MSTRDDTQHLPTLRAETCTKCGARVFFRFYNSRIQADGRFKIVYLRCPQCGAKASRLVEIVAPPD